MEKILLQTRIAPPKTEIYFGLDHLSAICGKNTIVVADENVADSSLPFERISIPAKKTREAKAALEDELFKRKAGRDTTIIGMGGGVLTDLVAFTASTYMRGVPLVLIPTTLLGMVDAAIGGKTGIDTPFGKNLIGTFYLPKAIFIEPKFLKTLPEMEMKNGLSEILKYGLIGDRKIWEKAKHWKEELPNLIRSSIECKCKVVEADFEEKTGVRRILNFGHTAGHALELLSEYQIPHGQAVALGCMAESYLSHILGYLSKADLETILAQYRKLGYAFSEFDPERFWHAISMDKKGAARFVLIDQIGRALPFDGEYCKAVERKEIDRMIEWMHHG
ncbi:MAG: 3-dehydroquinate synthase [Parachlamydiales bacterium]|nr:3-dehydroquinate synthase [Parachlamydiales bacterium]